jgi:hypothetical protein
MLLCVDATLDHSTESSVNGWKANLKEIEELFNRSPLARRLCQQFTVRDFLKKLRGMSGDHANNEKATAEKIRGWKMEETKRDLGEDKLKEKSVADLILYLASWNLLKITRAGGHAAWEALTTQERAERDSQLMDEIILDLGQEEFDTLSPEERHDISSFIWAGCCMHKDQNSFKGGNAEMMAEWRKLGVEGPILLANKADAKILHQLLQPGGTTFDKLTELEQEAFERSTRGGVKTTSLVGAILNNKNDKLGQGDVHSNEFTRRFPDTSNTRFGSHGLAACELIKHLDRYVEFVKGIQYAKTGSQTLTNIERNVLHALQDPATITELCAMAIYTNVISHPYVRAVRGPGAEGVNILDLGPLHSEVQNHIKNILDDPDLLFGVEASAATTSLDGKDWEDPDAIRIALEMKNKLPHLKSVTVAFFRGSLPTWTRFSAEFAPGGLIDQATPDEKHRAWMPATNDINEGRLGSFRISARNKPTQTLHSYNSQAMFSRNRTIEFMMALFEEEDYRFIRQEARRLDASKTEQERKRAQVEFRRRVIQMNMEKEEARKKAAEETRVRLSQIHLINDVSDLNKPHPVSGKTRWTGDMLDEQLDALKFRGMTNMRARSTLKVPDKRLEIEKWLPIYMELLRQRGLPHGSHINDTPTSSDDQEMANDFYGDEEREMEDNLED